MKLNLSKAYGLDHDKAENGVWFDNFPLGVRVRIAYIASKRMIRVQNRINEELNRNVGRRQKADAEKQNAAWRRTLAEGAIIEWDGVTDEDTGRPVRYTSELGFQALTDMPDFLDRVVVDASEFEAFKAEATYEDQEKNSSRASGTTSSTGETSSPAPIQALRREAG